MAKANRRFRPINPFEYGHLFHSKEGEYKIPIEYRQKFLGKNKLKWVNKAKYLEFLEWKKKEGK